MKAASIHEIKQQLENKTSRELSELTLKLARFKKENKELLTYLLFEADNEEAYIANICTTLDQEFEEVNRKNLYQAKKTIRKILRIAVRYIHYSGLRTTEVEVLLHFCLCLKELDLPLHKSTALTNLYKSQLKKIETSIASLHEDLQYDYRRKLERALM